MKSAMNFEEYNAMKEKREKKINSKTKEEKVKDDLIKVKKSKKSLPKASNNEVFRNNSKNYQYDYEEDFYEPY